LKLREVSIDPTTDFRSGLYHLKCIKLGSVRSSPFPFKMHFVTFVQVSLYLQRLVISHDLKCIRLGSVRLSHLPFKMY